MKPIKNSIKKSLIYRSAHISDLEQIKALGLAAFGKCFPELSKEDREKLKVNLSNPDNSLSLIKNSAGYVCETEGKLVGMGFLFPSGTGWEFFEPEWSYIRMVCVDPEFEGNGIGRRITEHCVNHAKRYGEKYIALHTSEKMVAARHIYESIGFKILKELEPRLGMRYWLYTLDLSS